MAYSIWADPICSGFNSMSSMKKWTAATYALLICMMIGFVVSSGLMLHFGTTSPRTPDPKNGKVNPSNYRGITVYLTDSELLALRISQGVMWISGLGAFAIVGLVDPFGFRNRRR